jgi:serine/threonine protein kinase
LIHFNSMAEPFGKYELLVKLAAGGMAEIYLARQKGLMGFERFVVIKKILPELSREERFILMFFDEARIAARLNHPNVIQVHDLGEQDGEFYIAMEYLEGQSLSTVIREAYKRNHPLPLQEALSIGIQTCEGLHYAHEMNDSEGRPLNLVHRDLSPQNIFVTYSGIVKVVDFGLARVEEKLLQTRPGTIKGKYAYMSPEQVTGDELDRRSDIFSLGVVMWETLASRRLFKHSSDLATAQAISSQQVPPPGSVRSGIPSELNDVILKALDKNPDKRYQTAQEFQSALLRVASEDNLQTGPMQMAEAMRQMFADTIAEQRELMLAAERGTLDQLDPGALKPQTQESLDFTEGLVTCQTSYSDGGQTVNDRPVLSEPATPGKRFPLLLVLVLVLFCASAALLAASGFFTGKEAEPVSAPLPAKKPARSPSSEPLVPENESSPSSKPEQDGIIKVAEPLPGRSDHYIEVCRSHRQKGRTGMVLAPVSDEPDAPIFVKHVCSDSKAERAGIRTGDVVTVINGRKTGNMSSLVAVLKEIEYEIKAVTVRRDERHLDILMIGKGGQP